MKNGKTPGHDEMTTDELKELEDPYLQQFLNMVKEIWSTENISEEICRARVVSIYKKEIQMNKKIIDLLAYSQQYTK